MKKGYFPSHDKNRMKNEGDVVAARSYFLEGRNKILISLLEQRFKWMNEYIKDTDKNLIELGCGPGLSKFFIENKNLVLTDVLDNDWVDRHVDALNIDYPDESLDVIICSNMLHHLAKPADFFERTSKKLAKGGRILIQDMHTSLLMKLVLRLMRHEGYSDYVDVFNRDVICNNPEDPWSANCSIPKLLFDNKETFEKFFPMYKIRKYELNECFMFYLSGGVIAKTFTLNIRGLGIKIIQQIDKMLVNFLPSIFAGSSSIVLEKISDENRD